LGLLGDPQTAADLVDALHDPVSAVRVQAAKALGHLRIPGTALALVGALRYHDEALASQIRQALLEIGPGAIPALMEAAPSPDAWVRWHVVRVLGDLHDLRGLHPLAEALADTDYAVAWMAARALAAMGASVVPEVLRVLLRAPDTPRLMEAAAYVLHQQTNPQMKGIVAPVVQSMHDVGYRAATPLAVDAALKQLEASGI
jgi:HEAT repeat protein